MKRIIDILVTNKYYLLYLAFLSNKIQSCWRVIPHLQAWEASHPVGEDRLRSPRRPSRPGDRSRPHVPAPASRPRGHAGRHRSDGHAAVHQQRPAQGRRPLHHPL